MYLISKKMKIRNCVFGLIIIFVLLFLYSSFLRPKLANYKLLPLWENNNVINDRDSGQRLSPDEELSENQPSPIKEISRQDGAGNSSKFIFINSYMRSGSTFLGKMLGFRSDVFYYYEPLHILWIWGYTNGSKLCDVRMPSCKYSSDALDTSLKFLSDVFNCRLQDHFRKMNQPLIKMLSGPKWNSFNKCFDQQKRIKECLVNVEEECLPTKYRLVKVLRMSLADAALLLPMHPNLVIVHLFRDPRGIFNSHIRTGWFPLEMENTEAFINDTKSICERLRADLVTGITLKNKFPDRVKLVQYEDIYGNAVKAKILYSLLGMELVQESEEFLRTKVIRNDQNTVQSRYISGPFKYRQSLPFEYVKIIDNECKLAIEMLGLKSYKSEAELHDKMFNPIVGKLPFELKPVLSTDHVTRRQGSAAITI